MHLIEFTKSSLAALLRHAATVSGGWLLANGIVDQSGEAKFEGAVLVLGGVGWSLMQKYGQPVVIAG